METSATQNYQLNIISYFDPVMAIQPSRLNWVNPLDHETRLARRLARQTESLWLV